MLSIIEILGFIMEHPLNRNQKIRALGRFLAWQFRSRLAHNPIIIPFINNSKLIVSNGMTGATGNIYCGLHEFEEMSFLLHLLRTDDFFIDIGANIGSYTVLAAAAIQAKCISIEPIPATFTHLRENITLNAVSEKVTALNIGVSSREGKLRFTSDLDTRNRVVCAGEKVSGGTIEIDTDTLNHLAGHLNPVLIKIDVEGFEANVLDGGDQVLQKDSLLALILEKNEENNRYSFNGIYLQDRLLNFGFEPYRYDPFRRTLFISEQNVTASNNVLYLKRNKLSLIKERLLTAAPFFVKRIRKEGI